MCVPHKPHPFGNEYQSIADGVTEKGLEGKPIVWRVKLQEGKDCPKKPDGGWAPPSEFTGYLKTATLMLEITKLVHHTDKVVSMDSGFCVSVGIIDMHNFGVYGQYLIKKRRYWPKKFLVTLSILTLSIRNLAVPKHSGRFSTESLSFSIATRTIGT